MILSYERIFFLSHISKDLWGIIILWAYKNAHKESS